MRLLAELVVLRVLAVLDERHGWELSSCSKNAAVAAVSTSVGGGGRSMGRTCTEARMVRHWQCGMGTRRILPLPWTFAAPPAVAFSSAEQWFSSSMSSAQIWQVGFSRERRARRCSYVVVLVVAWSAAAALRLSIVVAVGLSGEAPSTRSAGFYSILAQKILARYATRISLRSRCIGLSTHPEQDVEVRHAAQVSGDRVRLCCLLAACSLRSWLRWDESR